MQAGAVPVRPMLPSRAASHEAWRSVAAAFFFGLLALLVSLSDRLLADPDTYWHIAVGQRMWETWSVPWTDELSHTFAGQPWIAKEWLSQLILSAAYAGGGWQGVALVTAVTIALSFTLLLWLLGRRLQPTAALAAALVAVLLAMGHFLARPHVFALPVLILWVAGLSDAAERKASPPWPLLLVMVLWANLHASFTFGFVIAGLLGAEAVIGAPSGGRVRLAVRWGLFIAAAVAAAAVSPYGLYAMKVTFTLFDSGEAFRYVAEWQPLTLQMTSVVGVGLLLAALTALSFEPRQNVFRLLIVALCGFMMVRHGRFLSVFAIVTVLVAMAPLARRFPAIAGPAGGPPAGARASGGLAALVAAGLLAATVVLVVLRPAPLPSPRISPVAALEAARRLNLTGPVFNDYDFGGYLIFKGVRTFIDGRSDQLFIGGFMTALDQALDQENAAAFVDLLGRHGVTWSLVKPRSREARQLDRADGWERVHADEVASVYVRRDGIAGLRPTL